MGGRDYRRESDLGFEFLIWDFYYAGRFSDLWVGESVGGSQTYRLNFYFGISITLAGFLDLWVGGSMGGRRAIGRREFRW